MNIVELYNYYIKLKNNNLDSQSLELSLYQKLINLHETEQDTFIVDYINVRNMKVKHDTKFTWVSCMTQNNIENNYIKYYLSIPNNKKDEFLYEYSKFTYENNIRGLYKIRKNSQSNDLVTVRVYNPKNYVKVFEFLKKYVNCDINQHIFMPTIDGIGITIDDGGSYNKYLIDGLIDYFEHCTNDSEISNSKFIKYMISNETFSKMHSAIIYNLNLLNSHDKDFTLDNLINIIKSSQSEIENYPATRDDLTRYYNIINEILNVATTQGIKNALKVLNNRFEEKGVLANQTNRIINSIECHLLQLKDYNKKLGVKEFLKQQLINYIENIDKICNAIDIEYQNNGIDGIDEIFSEMENILNNTSQKYQLNLREVKFPNCHNDKFHPPIKLFYNGITLKRIYNRMLLHKNILEKEDNFITGEIIDKIKNIYNDVKIKKLS